MARVCVLLFASAVSFAACSRDAPGAPGPPEDAASPADVAQADSVDVDVGSPGVRVPDDFLGISVEWDHVASYLGDGTGAARPAVVALLHAFAAEGHVPVVRIGGNSEDLAWWKDPTGTRPQGVTIDIGPTEMATLAALAQAVSSPLVLGLDLRTADAANAALLVNAARTAVASTPSIALTFELGNEPDSYFTDWNAYTSRVDAFRDAVVANVAPPAPAFQWPALATRFWLPLLDAQLANERARVAIVSTHAYPFTVCSGLAPPPIALLLGDPATADIATLYGPHAAAAHAAGFRFRMGEMNSVSCGGAQGVSDTYAAALWGADVATALAGAGLDGVNFHTPGNYYALFVLDAAGEVTVRPLYYGMRLASLATAQHGRVLPLAIASAGRVRGFATLGDDGAARVLLLREDSTSGVVRLHANGANGRSASLLRLRAPSLDATQGLTLGGATYDGTTDGTVVGTPAAEDVARDGDAWLVQLGAYEAVVLTVTP
jgi:hypothetical protein